MKTATIALAVAVMALPLPALSQSQKPGVTGGAVVASEPGKAAIVSTVEVTATVVALDRATRTVTVKGPQRTVDIVAGNEVRNFDQIKVGDHVIVKYVEALSLELKKTKAPLEVTGDAAVARAPAGARPAGAVGREVHAIADVVAVDPKKSTISLKGPRGNVFELKVQNQDHFKVVKKGDQVEVVYTEALAVAVTPAPAKADGKKK
jgi:hypothetical protein